MYSVILSEYKYVRLNKSTEIKPFDCGNDDLNEFLFNDALNHSNQLLAVTNLYEYGDKTVSFYSVLNDKISIENLHTNSAIRRFFRKTKIPFQKRRYKSVPAVKIGRLGVDKQFQNKGIGTQMIDYIKISFTHLNKTGCRFITVDAYNYDNTLNFYKKNGFEFFTEKDRNENTRLMYFDLFKFVTSRTCGKFMQLFAMNFL